MLGVPCHKYWNIGSALLSNKYTAIANYFYLAKQKGLFNILDLSRLLNH